jgi:hypothetical protein
MAKFEVESFGFSGDVWEVGISDFRVLVKIQYHVLGRGADHFKLCKISL